MRERGVVPAAIRDAEREYLLVVTHRELVVRTGRQLADVYPERQLAAPSIGVERRLPLDHVFVMSIDNDEWLMEAARRGQLELPAFPGECVSRNANRASAMLLMDQQLETVGSRLQSVLVDATRTASQARLLIATGVPGGDRSI